MTLNDIKRMFNVTKTQYEFRLYKDIMLKINEIVKITEYQHMVSLQSDIK